MSACLLDDALLACEDDSHATEICDFGRADDEGVDVETSGCEDAGDAGENSGFVLDETVEDMALGGSCGGKSGFVEDRGDGGGGGDGEGGCRGGGERRYFTVKGFVGYC